MGRGDTSSFSRSDAALRGEPQTDKPYTERDVPNEEHIPFFMNRSYL